MFTLRAGSDLTSPSLLLLVSGLMDWDGEAAAVVRRGGLAGPWAASDALFPCELVAGAVRVGLELSVVFLCSQDMRMLHKTLQCVVCRNAQK